jgi:hypothetical protein
MITTNSTPWRRKFHSMEKVVPCHGESSSTAWRKHFKYGTHILLRSIISPHHPTPSLHKAVFCRFLNEKPWIMNEKTAYFERKTIDFGRNNPFLGRKTLFAYTKQNCIH